MSDGPISNELPSVPMHEGRPNIKNPWGQVAPAVMRSPAEEITPQMQDRRKQLETRKREKEALTEAYFSVSIDKPKLSKVEIPSRRRGYGETADAETTAARTELEATLERMKRLPEHLDFQPGITLIVGENGSGKSTLAKALYLAAQYKYNLEILSDLPSKGTHDNVFKPLRGDIKQTVFLAQAGLAPQIGEAMTADNFEMGQRMLIYRDVPEVIGDQHRNDMEMFNQNMFAGYDSTGRRMETGNYTGMEDYRSHRQTVDQVFEGLDHDRNGLPGIYFIDEPETGMSPRRHREIEVYMEHVIPKGSISIVPTNSVVLFESNLPRIDLEFPERGIYRPSEYPEEVQTTGPVEPVVAGEVAA